MIVINVVFSCESKHFNNKSYFYLILIQNYLLLWSALILEITELSIFWLIRIIWKPFDGWVLDLIWVLIKSNNRTIERKTFQHCIIDLSLWEWKKKCKFFLSFLEKEAEDSWSFFSISCLQNEKWIFLSQIIHE